MATRERKRTPTEAEYSSLRWAVAIDAEVHETGSCPLPVQIVDISVTGCRLWAGYRLRPGRPARLNLPGLSNIRAQVVWARDWYAALSFAAPFHPAVLRHLIETCQPVVPSPLRVASMTAPSIP